MILSGAVASSGASIIPISASLLVADAGRASFVSGGRGWYDDYCGYYVQTMYNGGSAGPWGTGSVNFTTGASYAVVIGASNGAASSFNSIAANSAGMSYTSPTVSGGSYRITGFNNACGSFDQMSGFGGRGSHNAFTNNNVGGNGANYTFPSGKAILLGAGGGGGVVNSWWGTVSGNSGSGSFNGTGGRFNVNPDGNPGMVVLNYSSSLPLPSSGSYSFVTEGGFHTVTVTTSTTLSWA